jgi:hypothetical protein
MPAKSGRAAPKAIAPARSALRALSGDASFDDFLRDRETVAGVGALILRRNPVHLHQRVSWNW